MCKPKDQRGNFLCNILPKSSGGIMVNIPKFLQASCVLLGNNTGIRTKNIIMLDSTGDYDISDKNTLHDLQWVYKLVRKTCYRKT